ncbi:FAD-binding oxidoreductase [Salinisphaera sp. USBA-960]|uniref:NAD(P)/FAD-dependent oxidoreductase n=1 Tax=Salinisphaera orenii TaxID=856731 RepID=UPI000DBE172A|nr:FAD-binding oxidoreductase [Salifodinibacter halophilus]NNC25598.1 FAD-binding oxidoreductase [Salifodinibacter halophilus]
MSLPESSPYVIIGAGIHGLSTALNLADRLRQTGRGDGRDIVVLDKNRPGAGATGIACGVVRNNYFQPAMRELMAHSVSVWEEDPENYGYHPVGYLQISCESMREDVAGIAKQQAAIGYPSWFVEGEAESRRYMQGLFDDWQAEGITSVLHEQKGGYANCTQTVVGLTRKVEAAGIEIRTGVQVTGFRKDSSAVSHVETDQGVVACDYVVVAVGPWIRDIWQLLGLPDAIDVRGSDGTLRPNTPMWTYWVLQEGTLEVAPDTQLTNTGEFPPVVHVDTDAPLYDGDTLLTDQSWGIYYKPDYDFGGVQGGAMPLQLDRPAGEIAVDPYGPESPEFVAGDDFARMWSAALAFCQKRFEGQRHLYKTEERSGGLGCFTPDSFPVFDVFHDNCYVIADSNHGFKMIGVGRLVADEIMGQTSTLLEPFRFTRYAKGEAHPVSNSPYPWS